MSKRELVELVPPPMPVSEEELNERRKAQNMSLIDAVEPIFRTLYATDDHFVAYNSAIQNHKAVEGNLECDDDMASFMIREYASDPKHTVSMVKQAKLAELRRALRAVRKRYNLSRKERFESAMGQRPQAAE